MNEPARCSSNLRKSTKRSLGNAGRYITVMLHTKRPIRDAQDTTSWLFTYYSQTVLCGTNGLGYTAHKTTSPGMPVIYATCPL